MCCVILAVNCITHVTYRDMSEISRNQYLSIIADLAPSDIFWGYLENPTGGLLWLLKKIIKESLVS